VGDHMDYFETWMKDKAKRDNQTTYIPPKAQKGDSKKDATKTTGYKWQTQLLKPLPTKTYGRTYDKKFKTAMNEIGVTDDNEMKNFLKWMNTQENTTFMHKVTANNAQSNRNQTAQNVFADMNKTANAKAQQMSLPKAPKVTTTNKTQAKKPQNKLSLTDDLKATLQTAEQALNPFDKVSFDDAIKKFLNRKTSKGFNELARGSNRAVDSSSLGIMSNLDKKLNGRNPSYLSERKFGEGGGTDMITSGLGYLVPGTGAYKALNGLKVGKALTEIGTKGLGKRLLTESAKGATIGAGLSSAETGVKEALNPNDQNWKENANYILQNTLLGAAADPALYGAGKVIGKGFETASNKAMKNLVSSNKEVADAVSSVIGKEDKIKPKEYTLPNGQKVHLKNRVTDALKDTETKMEQVKPKADAYQQEFNDAVQQQYEYLKSSMGKGVDSGTTSNGEPGNFREVTGRYSVSNNPKWYQDFYKTNGRKPTDAELKQLAQEHVLN
jgi:hypothetical protein